MSKKEKLTEYYLKVIDDIRKEEVDNNLVLYCFSKGFDFILNEWDVDKNKGLMPRDVTYATGKKVHWKCEKGHEWNVSVSTRTKNGSKCPVCANKKVLAGYNDLATTHPEMVKEWNYEKNKDLKPTDVIAGSNKKVWWKCKHGHEWEISSNNRIAKNTKCPVCTNKKVLAGFNDLATTHPQLLREWDCDRNKDLKPTEVTYGSNKRVYWKCKHGHKWDATINSRILGDADCPVCANRKVLKGFNDLATTHPQLAKEWDYTKNENLKPISVTYGSNKKVWWKCECGHSWETAVGDRTRKNRPAGCPRCANKQK